MLARCVFFFFQAEDGIRDDLVTGVQTCALPLVQRLAMPRRLRRRQQPDQRPVRERDVLIAHPHADPARPAATRPHHPRLADHRELLLNPLLPPVLPRLPRVRHHRLTPPALSSRSASRYCRHKAALAGSVSSAADIDRSACPAAASTFSIRPRRRSSFSVCSSCPWFVVRTHTPPDLAETGKSTPYVNRLMTWQSPGRGP